MSLDPSRCAIVVVDVQNDFCHPDGAAARLGQDVTAAQAIIPEIEALASAGRRQEVPVIFVRTAHSHWTDTPAWRTRGRAGTTIDVERAPIAEVGSWGAELFCVVPQPEDLVLVKHRYSAFAHTELELVLRAKRCDTVLLAGTRTNVCVEYTAVDALMRDLHPVLVRECVAADGDERQAAALREFTDHLGTVVSRGQVERAWVDHLQAEETR
jgi:ureidoacrylate peracid hydrolase